ncbi:hypothetical protein [Demequina salsinemoris]|nr:hypothetical protein [Demequina salsinemoris]
MSDESTDRPTISVWRVLASAHELTAEQQALLIATHTVHVPADQAA